MTDLELAVCVLNIVHGVSNNNFQRIAIDIAHYYIIGGLQGFNQPENNGFIGNGLIRRQNSGDCLTNGCIFLCMPFCRVSYEVGQCIIDDTRMHFRGIGN